MNWWIVRVIAPRHRRAYDVREVAVRAADGGGGVGGSGPAPREVGVEPRAVHAAPPAAGLVVVAHAGRVRVAKGLTRVARGDAVLELAVDEVVRVPARPHADAHQVAAVPRSRRRGGACGTAESGRW